MKPKKTINTALGNKLVLDFCQAQYYQVTTLRTHYPFSGLWIHLMAEPWLLTMFDHCYDCGTIFQSRPVPLVKCSCHGHLVNCDQSVLQTIAEA